MTIIETRQGGFSKVILCVMKKISIHEARVGTNTQESRNMYDGTLLDVLTWTMAEKTLLSCLDKMEPFLGIS